MYRIERCELLVLCFDTMGAGNNKPALRVERRRRMPLTENGPVTKPVLPFARRQGDLEKAKIEKWVELGEEALQHPPPPETGISPDDEEQQ